MKYYISVVFLLLVGTSTNLGLGIDTDSKPANLKSLSLPHKIGILAASQLPRYSSIKGLKFSDLFSSDDFPYVDFMFVDIRSLLTQAIKVDEAAPAPLPEIEWSYDIDLNETGYIINVTLSLWTAQTQMSGQNQTTSTNEITATSFKNSFHVPSFVWKSPFAGFKIYDNLYDEYTLLRDYYLGINNLFLNTSANYEFVPEVGIQISNLSIGFDMAYFQTNITEISLHYSNGTEEQLTPSNIDYREDLMLNWEGYQEDYTESLEFRINCVLSDSRNNPTRCALEGGEYYVNKDYFKMNVLQLVQTIGLGSLNRI